MPRGLYPRSKSLTLSALSPTVKQPLNLKPCIKPGHLEEIFTAVDHVLRFEFDLLKYSQGFFEESVSHAKVEA